MKIGRSGPVSNGPDGNGAVEARRPISTLAEGKPPIVETLGSEAFVKVKGVKRDGGRIVWFNWALAAELGLEVPKERKMTPELEKQLLVALNFEVPAEIPAGKQTVEMYADYYGGEGLGYNRGSARAAFFGGLNLNAKGIGVIKEMASDLTPYDHRHGGMSLIEGGLEAVWGEVNTNLFSRGSTRVLAVLDRGDSIVWENGGTEARGVAYRYGNQTRPAHLMFQGAAASNFDRLLRMLEETGDLVRGPKGVIDLKASLVNVARGHARSAAEQFRHRVLHGALSQSNMQHDGGFLDLGTETAQAGTAPVRVLEYAPHEDYAFGTEYKRRLSPLREMYSIVEDAMARKRDLRASHAFAPFSIERAFEEAYTAERTSLLTKATGLSEGLANEVLQRDPQATARFAAAAVALAAEINPGASLNVDKTVVSDASVVDLFGALGKLPRAYFLNRGQDLEAKLWQLLDIKGGTQPGQQQRITASIKTLASSYPALLDQARSIAVEAGTDELAFERSVIQRAEFENRPMDALFRSNLRWSLLEIGKAYQKSGDTDEFQRSVDRIIAHSLRSVDALKDLGTRSTLPDGTRLVEERAIRGVGYAVRLPPRDGAPSIEVAFPLERTGDGRFRLPSLSGEVMTGDQLQGLRYRHTVDGWKSQSDVSARIDGDKVVFSVPVFRSQAGELEGVFYVKDSHWWIKDRSKNFEGYVFAVPDAGEK